jgi:hypothetical protein
VNPLRLLLTIGLWLALVAPAAASPASAPPGESAPRAEEALRSDDDGGESRAACRPEAPGDQGQKAKGDDVPVDHFAVASRASAPDLAWPDCCHSVISPRTTLFSKAGPLVANARAPPARPLTGR